MSSGDPPFANISSIRNTNDQDIQRKISEDPLAEDIDLNQNKG
jgi:hypothetical protein